MPASGRQLRRVGPDRRIAARDRARHTPARSRPECSRTLAHRRPPPRSGSAGPGPTAASCSAARRMRSSSLSGRTTPSARPRTAAMLFARTSNCDTPSRSPFRRCPCCHSKGIGHDPRGDALPMSAPDAAPKIHRGPQGRLLRALGHHLHRRQGRRTALPRLFDPRPGAAFHLRGDGLSAAARRAADRGTAAGLHGRAEGRAPAARRPSSTSSQASRQRIPWTCCARRSRRWPRSIPKPPTTRGRRPCARASG